MSRPIYIIFLLALFSLAAHAEEEVPPVVIAPQSQTTLPQEGTSPPAEAAPRNAFTEALSSTYTTNPLLKSQREALKALDETIPEALSGFRPSIYADWGKGRQRQRTGANPNWTYFDTKSKDLTVEQPLFEGGRTIAAVNSARNRVKAGRARLAAVEQQVLLEAVTAYADVVQKESELELNRNNVEVLSKHRDIAKARFDAGDVTSTDVAQSDARLALASANLLQAEGAFHASLAAFEKVVGYRPGKLELPAEMPALPATLDETMQLALNVNPDIISARYEEKAAGYDVNQSLGVLLPSVSLNGSMSRSEGGRIPGISKIDSDAVTLNVTVPLYQSGAEYARLRAAKNVREQAKFNALDIHSQVRRDVESAWYDYQASLAALTSSEAAITASQSALEGVQREQEFGQRTTLDVLDAEQEFFASKVTVARAQHDKLVLAYRLLATAGQLTARSLALPVEVYDPIAHYDRVKWLPAGF